jgi:signal transduction histidine kinase
LALACRDQPDLTLHTVIETDPDKIHQVIGNLLSNAVKYTPQDGDLRVNAFYDEDAVRIEVSDTGPGIAVDEQDKVFEPFYRRQAARRFPQGLGLGHTIARDLVEAHGGRLEIASDEKTGSTFTVWLPDTLD